MSEVVLAVAYFAGGCFWCMEQAFETQPGVVEAVSGFIGGHVPHPSYSQVSAGGTGHAEAVKVSYDAQQISYKQLLEIFWHNVDPTVENRQFCDVGAEYRAGIYPQNSTEHHLAELSKQLVAARLGRNYVEIKPATEFYPAEERHQNYYKKNHFKYSFYKNRCGRPRTLKRLWGANPVFDWSDPSAPPSSPAAD